MDRASGIPVSGARVLLTGASSGIGAATARALAAAGATVGLVARRRDRLEQVQADCPGSRIWVADLADLDALAGLAREVEDAFGGLDVLVNNAGAPKRRHVTALTAEDVEGVMHVNYFSPVRLGARRAAGHARPRQRRDRQRGQPRRPDRHRHRVGLLREQVRPRRLERGRRDRPRRLRSGDADRDARRLPERDLGPAGQRRALLRRAEGATRGVRRSGAARHRGRPLRDLRSRPAAVRRQQVR